MAQYYERDIPGDPSQPMVDPATAAAPPQAPGNLIVRGSGPDIPAGQISVNGVLERSQAQPQGLPWWIKAYDEYKAQRQAEDDAYRMLQRIQSDLPQGQGAASGQKARQLQAELEYQADVRRGVPTHEALARHAIGMFGHTAPRAAVSAVKLGQPQTISPYQQQRLTLASQQLAQSKAIHEGTQKREESRVAATQKHQESGTRYQAAQKLATLAEKELESNPAMQRRDPARYKRLQANIDKATAMLEEQLSESPGTAQPKAAPNRVALANQIAAANPGWTKAQVIEAVRKQLP
jgi:hypothetical protein